MIKVRLKRVKRLDRDKFFNPFPMDHGFIEGTLADRPKRGESMVFHSREGGIFDYCTTTRITTITRHKTLVAYRTLNSIYHLKKGWLK